MRTASMWTMVCKRNYPAKIRSNAGGTLIIWDRLFGTFEAGELQVTEPIVYGRFFGRGSYL
jgi:hypothetical protein